MVHNHFIANCMGLGYTFMAINSDNDTSSCKSVITQYTRQRNYGVGSYSHDCYCYYGDHIIVLIDVVFDQKHYPL